MHADKIKLIDRAGWRVNEWAACVGVSRALVYELLSAGRVDSVKINAARIITTTPTDFLASLREPPSAP